MSSYHGERVLAQWHLLRAVLDRKRSIQLQGDVLDTASLVAVARYDPSVDSSPRPKSKCNC
jgi:hypothetical protein